MHQDPNIQALREFDEVTSKYLRLKLFGDKPEKIAKWDKVFDDQVFAHKF